MKNILKKILNNKKIKKVANKKVKTVKKVIKTKKVSKSVKVKNVTDKACFCELDTGLTGLLHFKEISFKESEDDLKKYLNEAQKYTDNYISNIEKILEQKKADILKV